MIASFGVAWNFWGLAFKEAFLSCLAIFRLCKPQCIWKSCIYGVRWRRGPCSVAAIELNLGCLKHSSFQHFCFIEYVSCAISHSGMLYSDTNARIRSLRCNNVAWWCFDRNGYRPLTTPARHLASQELGVGPTSGSSN